MSDFKSRLPGLPTELVDALNSEVAEPDPPVESGSGFSGGLTFEWNWDTETADADPGSGNVRGNNAVSISITQLFMSDITSTGTDLEILLQSVSDGDILIVTEQDDSDRWILGQVNGTLTDATTYWKIPLDSLQAGEPLRNNRTLEIQIIFT